MIPEINLGADILESTYCDLMTIYRPFKDTLSETGESVFLSGLDGKKIYEDIPCALSSQSGGKASTNGVVIKTPSDYKLFYRPEINIEKNDTIEVIHYGKSYLLQAGLEVRMGSHNELPVNLIDDEA